MWQWYVAFTRDMKGKVDNKKKTAWLKTRRDENNWQKRQSDWPQQKPEEMTVRRRNMAVSVFPATLEIKQSNKSLGLSNTPSAESRICSTLDSRSSFDKTE